MIQLHYYPSNASFTPHVLLEELGVPFELVLVDRKIGAHKSPAYLKLNPNGLIPTLVDGDLVLYETAAICMHLADTHPQAGLAPAPGTAERAQFYKWMCWLTNTLQAMLIHFYYPERMVSVGNDAGAAEVRQRAEARVVELLAQVDEQLAVHGGPWLLGQRYSAVDPFAFMLCRWTRNFGSKPAKAFTHIGPYLERVFTRPAVQRAVASEMLPSPVY
jgi:glutathione S-transferase